MMTLYFVGTGAAAVVTGLATTPFQLALGLASIGFFAAIYHPVGMAWLVRSAADRGKALGWNGMFGSFGVALGPVVAGALCQWWSWRAAFIVPGAITAAIGVALLVVWRAGGVADSVPAHVAPRKVASRTEMMRAFILLSVTMTCGGLIYQAFTVILPKLFAERIGQDFGLGASAIGGLVGLVYLVAGLTMPISGRLADRFPTPQIYRAAFLLLVPCLFVAALLQSWPLVFVTVLLVIINTLSGPAENKLLAHYTPGRWQGTGYGAKFVLSLGVSASAIPLIALIYESTGGFFWLFIAMGVLAAVATIGALLLPTGEAAVARAAQVQPRVAAAE